MANRYFEQNLYSHIKGLTFLEGSFLVGATGAVSSLKGSGISAVTRLAAGIYKITLEDRYSRLLGWNIRVKAPVTGAAVATPALAVGAPYEIVTLGNSDWNALGIPSGVSAAVGMGLVTLGNGAGNGTAKAVAATTGVVETSLVGDPQLTINVATPHIIFQCAVAAGTKADPTEGDRVYFNLILRNSTVKGKGE